MHPFFSSKGSVRLLSSFLLLGIFMAAGFGVAEYEWFPYAYVKKVESLAKRMLPSRDRTGDEPQPVEYVSTNALNMSMKEVRVMLETNGPGGGLTSFGDELVVVSFRGEIYVVNEDSAARTSIEAPDNGYDAFTRDAELEKFKEYEFIPDRLRFNDILYYDEAGERGLVLSYTEYLHENECYGTTLAQLKLPDAASSLLDVHASADDWSIIYRTQPCLPLKREFRAIEGHMAGGRIGYRTPHKIILANGDYHWDGVYAPKALAQESTNDYGKVLEIDLLNQTARTMSLGHRNMQGVLVDSDDAVWVTEHGPRGGDELNLISDGTNYGWPLETLGTGYNTLPWPKDEAAGRHDRFAGPLFAWVPSVGISNVTQISGFHPSWDGDLLVSSLAAQTLYRVRMHEGRIRYVEPISIGQRIRYVHQHTDGRIALWTDWPFKVVYLEVAEKSPVSVLMERKIAEQDIDPALKTRVLTAIDGCGTCHSFEAGDDRNAPGLGTMYESDIASTDFGNYSDALLEKDGVWSEAALLTFLDNPQTFAPGTSMPDPGLDDPVVLEKVVEILRSIKLDPE